MNDLNQISKLNAQAQVRAIEEQPAQGKHAIGQYSGLPVIDVDFFDSAEHAEVVADSRLKKSGVSDRFVVKSPAQLPTAA